LLSVLQPDTSIAPMAVVIRLPVFAFIFTIELARLWPNRGTLSGAHFAQRAPPVYSPLRQPLSSIRALLACHSGATAAARIISSFEP